MKNKNASDKPAPLIPLIALSVITVLIFTICSQVVVAASFTASNFQDPSSCGMCHSPIFTKWRDSMHANALSDPLFSKTTAEAIEDMGGKESAGGKLIQNFCYSCHTPIGTLIGIIPPNAGVAQDAVSCDFCHTVISSTGIGNASYVNSPGQTKQGPYKDAVSPAHGTSYSEFHTKSEFCGMCHDVYHPINGTPLETTYTEWKEGPYPAKGIQCQHCMMNPEKNTRAANDGPIRKTVFSHDFAGANTLLGNKTMATRNLKKAAKITLKVDKSSAKPGDTISVDVTVKNVGAGHKIPTGLTETRDMWLEIEAIDSKNKEYPVFKERYTTVLEDDKGKHDGHVPVWRAVKVFSDNRISPNEKRVYTKSFTIPAKITDSLTIVAAMNYRSAPQEITDHLNLPPFPEVEMTSVKAKITLPASETGSSDLLIFLVILFIVIICVSLLVVVLRYRNISG